MELALSAGLIALLSVVGGFIVRFHLDQTYLHKQSLLLATRIMYMYKSGRFEHLSVQPNWYQVKDCSINIVVENTIYGWDVTIRLNSPSYGYIQVYGRWYSGFNDSVENNSQITKGQVATLFKLLTEFDVPYIPGGEKVVEDIREIDRPVVLDYTPTQRT